MTTGEALQWLGIALASVAVVVALYRARRRVESERVRQMQPPTVFAGPGEVLLHIRYPGAAIVGTLRARVLLDRKEIGQGPVRLAFDFQVDTAVGPHQLELNAIVRTKKYAIEIPAPGTYVIQLSYDRKWGYFADGFSLAAVTTGPGTTTKQGLD